MFAHTCVCVWRFTHCKHQVTADPLPHFTSPYEPFFQPVETQGHLCTYTSTPYSNTSTHVSVKTPGATHVSTFFSQLPLKLLSQKKLENTTFPGPYSQKGGSTFLVFPLPVQSCCCCCLNIKQSSLGCYRVLSVCLTTRLCPFVCDCTEHTGGCRSHTVALLTKPWSGHRLHQFLTLFENTADLWLNALTIKCSQASFLLVRFDGIKMLVTFVKMNVNDGLEVNFIWYE